MELFVLNDELALFERQLNTLAATPRLEALVTLAWHLRQRDCERALSLAAQADAVLNSVADAALRQQLQARLLLVQAEVKLMFAELTVSGQLAQAAALTFGDDPIGRGDTYWLQASIAVDQGNDDQVALCLDQALTNYGLAADPQRQAAVMGRQLIYAAFRDPLATATQLQRRFPPAVELSAPVLPWVATARANVAALTNDPASAIKNDLIAYQAACDIGQLRQALVCVSNAVEGFTTLCNFDAALEWADRALTLAHSTRWPASVGVCQMQMGDVMRLIGRHDEAEVFLQQALQTMSSLSGSRNYEQAFGSQAQLALDRGDFDTGLARFSEFEQRVGRHNDANLCIKAWYGQASALCQLGRFDEADSKARAALDMAREHKNAEGQIQSLGLLARIATGPDPAQPGQASVVLAYLQQALEIAAGIDRYPVSPELLEQVAQAHAASGNFRAAYEYAAAANTARNNVHVEVARKRALALQISREIEQAQNAARQQQQIAASLQDTATTLQTLGVIGREITASLDTAAVFQTLNLHVNQLLDATFFAVYLLDPQQQQLRTAFGVEAGRQLPIVITPLDHPTSVFARCVRERQEVMIDRERGDDDPNLIPGTLPVLSLLYSPLMVGERVLGAMSIQSPQRHAYGERERSIFRTLCAYGAIALDNARAYGLVQAAQEQTSRALHELRQTQAKLVTQNQQLERLSVTDQLTGLANRLQLDRALEEEHSRSLRYASNFCVLLLDVDHFKQVNDQFGHLVGDQVLLGIAQLLQTNIREVDLVGRWGGEEFLIVCRETALEGALQLADKLRLAINAHVFEKVGQKSVSFGVAMVHPDDAVNTLLARADRALYCAKNDGRNRVACGEGALP